MKPALALLLAALALSACVTRPPADVAHVSLASADSPIVRVTKLWFERTDGRLMVAGYAVRQIDAKDTTGTHLDLVLFGQDGLKLRESVEHFEPRQIPRRPRMPDSVTFRLPLDPLPAGTARIEVRAHEGNH